MRRSIGLVVALVAVLGLLGWRLLWPERTVTLRTGQFERSPAVMVELGEQALSLRVNRGAFGLPVIKRFMARSEYSRFLYVARDAAGVYHGFLPRDPFSGCTLLYESRMQAFHDPCWGAVYDLSGEHMAGPGGEDLGEYPVVEERGRVRIDLEGAPTSALSQTSVRQ